MLIADEGGSYGGTHWMAKEVPAMWAAIANQDTEAHYQVVGGWSKTADLTLAHLAQVRAYRDNLASVWPPSKSPAAAAYIARLDKLMVDLQATHDAASANYTAFSTVTLTLSMARKKLQELYNKYESNAKQNYVWQQKQEAAAASPTPSPTPSPSGALKVPPVPAAQQEELNRQARIIMYDLSNTLMGAQATLKKPKPYDPAGAKDDVEHGGSTGDPALGFAVPPLIPPPGAGSIGPSGSTFAPVSNSTITPAHPPATTPIGPSTGVGVPGNGPVLGSVGPPVITPPTPGPLPTPGPSPVPPPQGLLPGLIGPGGGTGLTPSGAPLPHGGKASPHALMKPGMGTGPAGRVAMPSGGVIGATPGSGLIGQVPPAGTGARAGGQTRANPVGGVIGQQGTGTLGRSTSAGVHGLGGLNTPLANPSRQLRGRRDDDAQGESWDPDNPWATAEGVAPVVRPPGAPAPIDPGPAIGYSR